MAEVRDSKYFVIDCIVVEPNTVSVVVEIAGGVEPCSVTNAFVVSLESSVLIVPGAVTPAMVVLVSKYVVYDFSEESDNVVCSMFISVVLSILVELRSVAVEVALSVIEGSKLVVVFAEESINVVFPEAGLPVE